MYFIVPQVKHYDIYDGYFTLTKEITVNHHQLPYIDEELRQLFSVNYSDDHPILTFSLNESFQEEAYELLISQDKINISYKTENGAFYALKTLKQIINQVDSKIRNLKIYDYPTLKTRGFMLDISRNKIPTIKTIYQIVDTLSDLKYNHFETYVEGFSFGYESFKEFTDTPLTVSEYQALEAYCKRKFIDLVPNQNGFGHMAAWIKQDEFKYLAECPEGIFLWGGVREASTINPLDPRSVNLVKKMYDDMLPYSTSNYFNMNFDEPFELGFGKSKAKCEKVGVGKVYVDYMKKLYDHIKTYNKTPMIWADVLKNHLDLKDEIPSDIILLDWGYDMDAPFKETTKAIKDSNLRFLTCPGTSSWCSITGRTMDMLENIKNASTYTHLNGGEGMLLTDWGDCGHLQYLPFTYPGLIYAAYLSWGNGDGISKHLSEALNRQFKDQNRLIGDILLDLGRYNQYEGSYTYNGTKLFQSLLVSNTALNGLNGEPLSYYVNQMKHNIIPKNHNETLVDYFDFILKRIDLVDLKCDNNDLIINELKQSIYLLKTLLRVNQMLDESYSVEERKVLTDIIIKELDVTMNNHKALWLQRNRTGGLQDSLRVIENLKTIVKRYQDSL